VEDQTRTQDPNPKNPLSQEGSALGEGCLRADDAGLGQLTRHERRRLSFGLRWAPGSC